MVIVAEVMAEEAEDNEDTSLICIAHRSVSVCLI